jgi:hypothetical protein
MPTLKIELTPDEGNQLPQLRVVDGLTNQVVSSLSWLRLEATPGGIEMQVAFPTPDQTITSNLDALKQWDEQLLRNIELLENYSFVKLVYLDGNYAVFRSGVRYLRGKTTVFTRDRGWIRTDQLRVGDAIHDAHHPDRWDVVEELAYFDQPEPPAVVEPEPERKTQWERLGE